MDFKTIDVSSELKVSFKEVSGILVITSTGELYTYNSTQFQRNIEEIINKKEYNKIIFNCDGLSYVSSTGIGAFTSLMKACGLAGIEMALSNIRPRVYEVFALLGFTNFFRIFDDENYALEHFSNGLKPLFPKILHCPSCSSKLKVTKSGRFRCVNCKSIVVIDSKGSIFKE